MRHPTTGLSEDDLSRLTGSSSSSTASADSSSSSTSSSSSSSSNPSSPTSPKALKTPDHKEEGVTHPSATHKSLGIDNLANNINSINNNNNNNTCTNNSSEPHEIHFKSTYLPEFINPLEWQKSRKRKERLDSSSSATQDRKLQRSNSEETVPTQQQHQSSKEPLGNDNKSGNNLNNSNGKGSATAANEVIRRVSSEDFKRTPYAVYEQELKREAEEAAASASAAALEKEQQQGQSTADENDASVANKRRHHQEAPWFNGFTRDMTRRTRYETSPARSQRHSPQRNNGGGKHRDSDDSECEHERRRSSERFSKTRAPPGRKASGVSKKSVGGASGGSKYLPSKRGEENVYKYDISALKNERRGFISKKNAANYSASSQTTSSDHNDNNLIDLHQQSQPQVQSSPSPSSEDSTTITSPHTQQQHSSSTNNSNQSYASSKLPLTTSAQEALPWERSAFTDEPAPVLSRRYAAAVRHHRPADICSDIDTAAKLSKVMPYPQHFHKPNLAAQRLASDDDLDGLQPLCAFRAFTSLENLRTREVMQQIIPAIMSFQSPEERLKQVNKRLTAMKKKLAQLEESYEARMGYRPSQADRLNDKYMKNVMAELSKLRKERHELKSDPMGALGLKVSGGMDDAMKLEKIKETLAEIEQNLTDKREDANRSETLDELTPDQLVQEKTAVQHGLLYFESLYGRPTTKDERDAARSLYDRYRQLKRMVSRSVLLVGGTAGAPELPTILEHEAMVFESTPLQYSSANSTETTNSPSAESNPLGVVSTASDESTPTATTNNTTKSPSSAATTQSDANENISALNIEQLWELLDRTREDKKLLKRTIREYETIFEEQNGRKMLKNDRKLIEETYAQYKEKKAKTRLLQALIKKHISR